MKRTQRDKGGKREIHHRNREKQEGGGKRRPICRIFVKFQRKKATIFGGGLINTERRGVTAAQLKTVYRSANSKKLKTREGFSVPKYVRKNQKKLCPENRPKKKAVVSFCPKWWGVN